MKDDDPLSDVDWKSIRILATSTKAGAPANARIAERLERAAGTGDRADYRRAEASFDALPADERRRIGTQAEKQAETERRLVTARKRRTAERKAVKPARVDDSLDWKPLLLDHSPATDDAPPAPRARAPADASRDGGNWRLGGSTEEPSVPRSAKPRPETAHPATSRAAAGAPPVEAARRGRHAIPVEPEPVVEANEPDQNWDWQRVPDDPVLRSSRKATAKPLDPIQELRRQVLGDATKRK